MKKIFKALAITAASTALCAGIATATGCAGGNGTYYGEYHYIGAHSATPYGMVVEVKVENNIITSIKDITNTEDSHAKEIQTYKDIVDGKEAATATYHAWTTVSTGWETYFGQLISAEDVWILSKGSQLGADYEADAYYYANLDNNGNRDGKYTKWEKGVIPEPIQTNIYSYGWTDKASSNWSDHESWLLQQYVGWSVADILAIDVYTNYGYALESKTEGWGYNQVLDINSKGEPYGVDYNAGLSGSGLLISGATQGSGRLLLAVQDALGK